VSYRFALLAMLLAGPVAAQSAAPGAPARDTLRLVFVGDLNFARSLARSYIFAGRADEVFAGVRDRLRAADVAVANLESILLDRGRTTDTTNAMQFAGPVEALGMMRAAGLDILGTANNHIWDFGRAGLEESMLHLDTAGFQRPGTGRTRDEAWRPGVVRAKGWTVAVYSLTAIFNYTNLTVVGHPAECCVAWADTVLARERFRAVRDSLGADAVIVSLHAGLEYRAVPELAVVALARGLVRAGADAVIGHHPHVPQGIEVVDGRPIAYSLGNFVFKQYDPWTDVGLWAELTLLPDGTRRFGVLPLRVGYTPRFATGADSTAIMAHVDSISALIGQPAARRRRRLPNRRTRRNVLRLAHFARTRPPWIRLPSPS
jgi:poly-gamma-glutamate synthesis protein (capsule biosynthesis protein)